MKQIVVTGASTGIGFATTQRLCRKGYRVYATIRRPEDGARLKALCGENLVPLELDITDQTAVAAAAQEVAAQLNGKTLFGLVNNAGIAMPGPLLHLPLDDLRRQMEVNLIAQLGVTQSFAPLLGAKQPRSGAPGRIVMMSSVSGKNAFPFIGAYAASKFALEGMSEALRRELLLFDIPLILIRPGAIATPIWDKAAEGPLSAFAQTPYGPYLEKIRQTMTSEGKNGLPPERVARLVEAALSHPKPRLTYTIRPSLLTGLMLAVLPKRQVDKLIAARLGLNQSSILGHAS